MLSDEYETAAREFAAESLRERFLQSLASGTPLRRHARSPLEISIASAFSEERFNGALNEILDQKKLGEALLRSLEQFSYIRRFDPFDVGEALFALVQSGLRREATRIALQLLIATERA